MGEILAPQFDNPQALPYGGESGVVRGFGGEYRHSDVLGVMRRSRPGMSVHSDGFLSFGGMVEAVYECGCGFRGMIWDGGKCSRCGGSVSPDKSHKEATNV